MHSGKYSLNKFLVRTIIKNFAIKHAQPLVMHMPYNLKFLKS